MSDPADDAHFGVGEAAFRKLTALVVEAAEYLLQRAVVKGTFPQGQVVGHELRTPPTLTGTWRWEVTKEGS